MGPCDDLPAKPELLHWERVIRARRDLVTQFCRASVNSAIKEHGVMCRLTATAFAENDPSVRTLISAIRFGFSIRASNYTAVSHFDSNIERNKTKK
ncbi:hypothetical protein AVEN_264414-1 [Araneus ventricosus]|uniref:Uncharacterized protein n=1 Tax=Araneus ventricosus TaxID=182803 RepID=A0A4Y2HTQ4_ARAVE|nr:hypothetical protein AVEN_264414-1 [Araneus ventricosus]